MTATAPHIITDGKQLSLADFRTCMFGGDLSPLGGEPEERPAAWEGIRCQYYEWFCGGIFAFIVQMRDINALASRIERIEALVSVAKELALAGIAAEEIVADLQAEGFAVDIDGTIADYTRQLAVISAQLAPHKLRLRQLQKDLPEPKAPEDAEKALQDSEDAFDGMLVDVSRYMKFSIDEDKTTLYKLHGIVKRMIKEYKTTKPDAGGI